MLFLMEDVAVAVDASVVLATEDVYATDVEDVYATDVEDVYAIDAEESKEQEVRCGILLETKDLSVETGLRENGQGGQVQFRVFQRPNHGAALYRKLEQANKDQGAP